MWSECSKEEYWNKVHDGGDYIVSSDPGHTTWTTRRGDPVARSSHGYSRPTEGKERFYVWA